MRSNTPMQQPACFADNRAMLDQCIIHGFGYLGSRITGLIEGTRRVQNAWTPVKELGFRIVAIVERDPQRYEMARASYPQIPCFDDIEAALEVTAGPTTFIKDFTSPNGRERLLNLAHRARVPVLLEKPLSFPGVEISLSNHNYNASVSMSEAFNPVVHALAAKMATDVAHINSLAFVRVNSLALERLRSPSSRPDIVGGAFVDKLSHDIHLLVSGTLLGPVNVEFDTPEIQEIAYDVRTQPDSTNLCFTSLSGTPLSRQEILESDCDLSEMMVDFTMQMKLDGRPVPTRWIASWAGVPTNLANTLGIGDTHIEASRMVSASNANVAGYSSYRSSNLKLIVCNYVNSSGEEAQLICNLQARGSIKAWVMERRNGTEHLHPIQYSVSILKSMESFSQHFRTGGYLDLCSIVGMSM